MARSARKQIEGPTDFSYKHCVGVSKLWGGHVNISVYLSVCERFLTFLSKVLRKFEGPTKITQGPTICFAEGPFFENI